MKTKNISEPRESGYTYSTCQIPNAENAISGTSGADGTERKMASFQGSMPIFLGDQQSSCTAGFGIGTKSSEELDWLPILTSHYCDISYGKKITGSRHASFLKRLCASYLSVVEDTQQPGRVEENSMFEFRQVRV